MTKTFVKFASVCLMLLSCFCIFAEGNLETAATETVGVSASGKSNNKIIENYIAELQQYQDDYEKYYVSMQMAYQKGDADAYLEAKKSLRSLTCPEISEEDSNLVEKMIVESNDLETAKLLYQYSKYYHPVLTFSATETGFNYNSSIAVLPGSEITLPNLRISNRTMIMKGWGYEQGVVDFQPGETIQMPLESKTLYAVFEKDPSIKDGASVEIKDLKVNGEDTLSVPRNKQFDFSFIVKNDGSEALNNVEVSFESDDPLLVILTDTLSSRYVTSYEERTATYRVITKAKSGTQLSGVITVCDASGNKWTKDVTFTVE